MIRKVKKIKDCGSFQNFDSNNDLPEFRQYNLIYGWNGSGKSTFTNILRSFEIGVNFFGNGEFEFKLDDGSIISSNNLNVEFPQIRVYNENFVKDNIIWEEGMSKPIFYVGEEESEIVVKIKEKLEKLKKNHDEFEKVNEDFVNYQNQLDRLLQGQAKNIKEHLNIGHDNLYINYNSRHIAHAINNYKSENMYYDKKNLDKKKNGLLKKIGQSLLEKVQIINIDFVLINNTKIFKEFNQLMSRKIANRAIERLKEDPILNEWVKNGLKIHEDKDTETCQYCGQGIPKKITAQLKAHFNDEYKSLEGDLNKLINKIKNWNDNIIEINKHLKNKNDFYNDLQKSYIMLDLEIKNKIVQCNQIANNLLLAIDNKQKNLSETFVNANNFNDSTVIVIIKQIIENINKIIITHNLRTEEFDNEIKSSKKELEYIYISEFIDIYDHIISDIEIKKNKKNNLEQKIDSDTKEIKILNEKISKSHKSAQKISINLQKFLGRDDIEIKVTQDDNGNNAFQMERNGKPAKNLSEGERNAIALVYFLGKLEEEGFDRENAIVVIDDPVSSLDSGALFQAFSYIKESVEYKIGQIIFLTHNSYFLRLLKDWFFYINSKLKEYFMFECETKEGDRYSIIKQLDPLLKKYLTEYHFLFAIIYRFVNNGETDIEHIYSLPNIARKFLDIFLSFKYYSKKNYGLHARMEKANYDKITKDKIRKFVDINSHSCFSTASHSVSTTQFENAKSILTDLLDMIEKLDSEHYKMLKESLTESIK